MPTTVPPLNTCLPCQPKPPRWGGGVKIRTLKFKSEKGQEPQPPTNKVCNLRGHLQRCQMPDIENSRKGCRVGHGKTAGKTARKTAETPEKQPKSSQNSCFSGVLAVFFRLFFPAVFRLFYRDPLGALFGCFSAVFNVSGIWHLCRWPRRLQNKVTI